MTDIREKVAEDLWQAESVRALGKPRLVPWSEVQATDQARWRLQADAALEASGYHRMREALKLLLATTIEDLGDCGYDESDLATGIVAEMVAEPEPSPELFAPRRNVHHVAVFDRHSRLPLCYVSSRRFQQFLCFFVGKQLP